MARAPRCRRSRRRYELSFITLVFFASAARAASAQDGPRDLSRFLRSVPAPERALEVQIGGGYSQGVGALGDAASPTVQDVASVGFGAEVDVSYRASPRLSVGAFATGGIFAPIVPDTSVRSFSVGLALGWHFRPYRSLDPWITLGSGYRAFWVAPPGEGTTSSQAIEVARVGLGVDYRLGRGFAVGPSISADLSLFVREHSPSQGSRSVTALSSFVGAGISARFDFFGGKREPPLETH
ncbi:MAG TPA: outer membrane beta-barrel protein [Polyangiaceae bacterium]|nr:outer membrane beta-barrel protein [Polyangiaceae bacterium]